MRKKSPSEPATPVLNSHIAFVDGACSGNPGPGGWGAILVRSDGTVEELGGGSRGTTNNRMELTATIEALDALAGAQGAVDVYTDSTYVIRGITQWSWAWRTRGWKTAEGEEVSHSDLWKNLIRLLAARGKENPVRWHYVRGHTGVPGNERADEIAVSFTKSSRINLYSGPLLKYDIPVFDIPEDTSLPPLRERESGKSKEKATPYSYLSLVNGELRRHPTWKDCEARVKGRPGAKFKKAMTEAEEKEILRTWGIS